MGGQSLHCQSTTSATVNKVWRTAVCLWGLGARMNRVSIANRTLLMHAAHKSVGVSGAAFYPYCPPKGPAAGTIRALLTAFPMEPDASDALDAFERIAGRQPELKPVGIDFDAVAKFCDGSMDADCLVMFARGVCVFGRGTRFDADLAAIMAEEKKPIRAGRIKVTATAPWHPVLDRVCEFDVPKPVCHLDSPSDSALCLLTGRIDGETGGQFPLAWAEESPSRRFCTSLGTAADLRRPDFVQLLLNAIEWAGDR